VFPGTIFYLTRVKKDLSRPVEPGTLRVFTWGVIFTPLNVYLVKFKDYLTKALTYSTGAKTIPLGSDPFIYEG